MKVAFIGLGNMGQGMASRILEAGFDLTVYNRTADKTLSLVSAGAKRAQTPKEAVSNADILITMVNDDQALNDVLFGDNGALKSLKPNAIHISMSTISDALAEKLSNDHTNQNVSFVGAPVFGRPPAAASGKLFILAAGSEKAIKDCDPIFKVLGQKLVVVGVKPSQAHLTKILGNFMLFSAIESLAEAMANIRAAGINERIFLEAMTSTIFSAPFYTNYGTMMVQQNYPTQQAVSFSLALKDIKLAIESSKRSDSALPTAELVQERLLAGIANGYGNTDVSALTQLAFNQR